VNDPRRKKGNEGRKEGRRKARREGRREGGKDTDRHANRMNKIIVTVNFTPRCISIMPSCD
jgi:hypothetical protein